MRIALLFSTAVIVIYCAVTDGILMRARALGASNEQTISANHRAKEQWRDYESNVEKSIFKNHSERAIGRIFVKNDAILNERKDKQFSKDMASLARAKRQVLNRATYPNSTWMDGVFYAFNTSGQFFTDDPILSCQTAPTLHSTTSK
uniref:Inhibitor_I29 domain-containing protein n=1 Tax=Angiostrongylus cantonensis TaxID=6313 RepID=A0A0K0DKI6_ANGCA